jgi:hypothetical protein
MDSAKRSIMCQYAAVSISLLCSAWWLFIVTSTGTQKKGKRRLCAFHDAVRIRPEFSRYARARLALDCIHRRRLFCTILSAWDTLLSSVGYIAVGSICIVCCLELTVACNQVRNCSSEVVLRAK